MITLYTCKACYWTENKTLSRKWGKNNTILSCRKCNRVRLTVYEVDKQVYNKYNKTFLDERTWTIIAKVLEKDLNSTLTMKAIMRIALMEE